MSLRDHLVDLLGAEIQTVDIALSGRKQKVTFRQVSDAEGREIFKPGPDDETNADRGKRVMAGLVAASVCDKKGKPMGTFEEAKELPGKVLALLYNAAAVVNNIVAVESKVQEEGEAPPKS